MHFFRLKFYFEENTELKLDPKF